MGSSIKTPRRDDRSRDDRAVYYFTIAPQAGGGILATRVLAPPSNDDGDIIGRATWFQGTGGLEARMTAGG